MDASLSPAPLAPTALVVVQTFPLLTADFFCTSFAHCRDENERASQILQGPLKIWKEDSNCPLHTVLGSCVFFRSGKNPLNNQKILCHQRIFQFERTVTDLIHPNSHPAQNYNWSTAPYFVISEMQILVSVSVHFFRVPWIVAATLESGRPTSEATTASVRSGWSGQNKKKLLCPSQRPLV